MSQEPKKTPRMPRYVDAVMSAQLIFRIDLDERRVVEAIAPPTEMGQPTIETVRGVEPPYEAGLLALDIVRDGDLPDLRVDDFFRIDPDPLPDGAGDLDPAAVLSRVLGDADLRRVDVTDIFLNDLVRFLSLTAPDGEPSACLSMDAEGRFLNLRWFPERPAPSQVFDGTDTLMITCELIVGRRDADALIEARREWIQTVESEAEQHRAELHDHLVIHRHDGDAVPLVSFRRHQGAQGWWK